MTLQQLKFSTVLLCLLAMLALAVFIKNAPISVAIDIQWGAPVQHHSFYCGLF